jgi:hypothetical protein
LDRKIGYRKGRLRNWKGAEKVLTENAKGYLKVRLFKNGKSVTREVQRFVAEAFIPNPEHKEQVNHIDGNKHNNNVSNLEWTTPRENTLHSYRVLKRGIKKVSQYDLQGNYIRTYDSLAEAARTTHTHPCSISNVVCGRRQKAGGYKWRLEV